MEIKKERYLNKDRSIMFVKECFLRNVGEAKMYVMLELTRRGYSPMYMKFENNVGGNNVVCEGQTWHCTDSDNKPYCIDCGENIDLFLAIASLREDTDKYQWFTDGRITEMSADDMPSKYMQLQGHKCTVEELIEIFTKPKNEGFLPTETLKRIGGLKNKK